MHTLDMDWREPGSTGILDRAQSGSPVALPDRGTLGSGEAPLGRVPAGSAAALPDKEWLGPVAGLAQPDRVPVGPSSGAARRGRCLESGAGSGLANQARPEKKLALPQRVALSRAPFQRGI